MRRPLDRRERMHGPWVDTAMVLLVIAVALALCGGLLHGG